MIVLWRITDRCNLACGFCAHDRRLPRKRMDANPAQVLRFAELLAQWQQQTGRPVLLSWLGGEPLLWPPLLTLDRQIRGMDSNLRLSQTSNGTRLHDPAVRAHLLEHYAELTLSVDAAGTLHDQLRGFH
jgi:sulfatase maturation enzyme AslB (radical SAM superfamily)